jgi:hypothetical protein
VRSLVLGFLLVLQATSLVAETPDLKDASSTVAELKQLNATMSQIARLLARQVALERLTLLNSQLEAARAVVRSLEGRLRQIEEERVARAEERNQREGLMKNWSRTLERTPPEADAVQFRDMLSQGEFALKQLEQTDTDQAAERDSIENDLGAKRRDLKVLEALLATDILRAPVAPEAPPGRP